MFDNNSSLIITNKKQDQVISWITILIISLIVFLTVGFYYEYPKYLNNRGNVIKKDEEYFIKSLIMEENIQIIKKSKLIIDNKKLDFNIDFIDPIYYLDDQNNRHYEVMFKTNLTEKLKKDNLPILLKFELSKTTLIKELVNKIKKGMM